MSRMKLSYVSSWIRNWYHIATHDVLHHVYLVLLVFLVLDLILLRFPFVLLVPLLVLVLRLGATLFKKPKAPSFQIGSGWTLPGLSSTKYAWIDGVGFSIWRHTFKTAAMTPFHAKRCCHLVSAHAASAWHICSSVRQFLIRSRQHSYVSQRTCLRHSVVH